MHFGLLFLSFLLFALSASGQKLGVEAAVVLQSRHVWRGSQLGDAIAVEPSVTLSSGRFSFNLWAAKTTNNSYTEIDLIPSYQFDHFAISLLDYYNPVSEESNRYTNLQKGKNRHSLELNIDNYSIQKRGLKWMIGTFIFGDRNEETGNPNYSTYAEIKYPFTFLRIEIETFTGLTPFRGYYAKNFAVINSGVSFSKEFDLKLPFSIPLSLSFILNPYTKQSFVIFAGGIAF